MAVPCRHKIPDNSRRRNALCKETWYFLALAFNPNAANFCRARCRIAERAGISVANAAVCAIAAVGSLYAQRRIAKEDRADLPKYII